MSRNDSVFQSSVDEYNLSTKEEFQKWCKVKKVNVSDNCRHAKPATRSTSDAPSSVTESSQCPIQSPAAPKPIESMLVDEIANSPQSGEQSTVETDSFKAPQALAIASIEQTQRAAKRQKVVYDETQEKVQANAQPAPKMRRSAKARAFPEIPDVPVLIIMDYLPLEDLVVRTPLVCTNWQELSRIATNKRTTITLLVNDHDRTLPRKANNEKDPSLTNLIHHNLSIVESDPFVPDFPGTEYTRLCLPGFNRAAIRALQQLFPSVCNFQVAILIPSSGTLRQIVFLLEQWRETLHTVKLWTWWDENQNETKAIHFRQLFGAIDELAHISTFVFFADTNIFDWPNPLMDKINYPNIDMPFLRRLIHFKFYTLDPLNMLFPSLMMYAEPNTELRNIEMGNTFNHDAQTEQLSSEFMQRFSQLSAFGKWDTMQLLSNAINLTVLDLETSANYSFVELIQDLEPLTSLRQIRLDYWLMNHCLSKFDATSRDQLPRLESVREVFFKSDIFTHKSLDSTHLGHIFPGVELVTIYFFMLSCSSCGYDICNADRREVKQCVLKMANTWRQCTTIEKVWLLPDIQEEVYSFEKDKHVPYDSLVDKLCVNLAEERARAAEEPN